MASQVLDINVPEVTPQGPVNTSENIPSTPGMFGGFGAQAAEKAGQGIETAADTGLDVMTAKAHLTNEIHAGELNSWLADKLTDEYSNFSQLRGRAAQEALPQFKQRIEDLRKQSIGQAGNLQTQALVSNANRFLADKFYSYGTGHADKEFRVWADQTAKDRASNYAGVAAIAAQHGDFNGLETALGTSDDEVRKLYEQSAGDYGATGDPDFIDRNVKNNRSHNLKTIIETMADTDPGMSAMVYKKYKDQLLPQDQLTTLNKLKTQSVKIDAIDRVDGMMGKTSSPMDIAEKQIGLNEVKDRGTIAAFIHNVGGQNVDPALTPWCASWANAVLKSAGYQGTNSAAARSFLNYGQPVSQPTRGDIVVLSRGNDPSKGHVGFYEGPGSTPGTIRILGGNQNDSVSVSEFPEASVIGYRRIGAGDVPRTPPVGPGPSVFVQQSKGDAMQQILDDPELKQNPQLRDAMLTELNKRYTAQQVDFLNQERMEKVKETKQKNDYKAATDELLTGMQKDDPSWDAQRIMSDPRFAYNREHALGLLQSKVSGNADAATYGKDFYSLFRRIHAPQDDPSRITDPDALNAHLGNGGLTLSGLKQLRQEISEKGTAQGDADGAMKKTFLANAHRQISGRDPLLRLEDPKGEEQYLKFLANFFPAYDKGIKDGKTPSQLLNPESPDYLGKSVGQFKRSPAQQYADLTASNAPGQGIVAPAAFDEKTATPQQLISMVHNNQISRDEAERIALSKGWIRPNPAPQPNVQVPTSQ